MSKQERLKTAFQYLKNIGKVHTQKDVAEAMGASKSNVSSAFKGVEKVLTDSFVNRFARTYGLSFDWLLTGNGEMIAKESASTDNSNHGAVTTIGDISGITNSPTTVNNGNAAELLRVIESQEEQIRAQHEQIRNLTDIIRNLTSK